MSKKKSKSADEEIQYFRSKKPQSSEEVDPLDTLLSGRIEAAADALFAIVENLSPMDELKLNKRLRSDLGKLVFADPPCAIREGTGVVSPDSLENRAIRSGHQITSSTVRHFESLGEFAAQA